MLYLRQKLAIAICCLASIYSATLLAQTTSAPVQAELPKLNATELAALLDGKRGAYMLVASGILTFDIGQVHAVALDKEQRPTSRTLTNLSCPRLSLAHTAARPKDAKLFCFSNRQSGLHSDRQAAPIGLVFSNQLSLLHSFEPQRGITAPPLISRARISTDGKYVASTVFTVGAGYTASGGGFSTEQLIGKTDGTMPPENIEKWKVMEQNGSTITSPDVNLWGATFDPSNSDRFLVTVSTKGKPRLAEGSVARKQVRIINSTADIECPSFSPDGKKIAFKRVDRKTNEWSPSVLDLATGVETIFKVGHMDDQIEWLNNQTLIYEVRTNTAQNIAVLSLMTLDIRSPSNQPQLFLEAARSPSFFRL